MDATNAVESQGQRCNLTPDDPAPVEKDESTSGTPDSGSHSEVQQSTSSARPISSKYEPWAEAFALDLLDKQYRLYSWSDAKALSLITTNSLLLAAIGFLFKECLQDILATLLISFGLIFAALSLFFSLVQVIPQGSSGKGGSVVNLRALSGILTFPNWEAYDAAFHAYTLDHAIRDTLRQAYGMAHNTDRGRKSITRGVRLTITSLLFVVLSAFAVAGAAGGYNMLGKWQKSSEQEKGGKMTIQDRGVSGSHVPLGSTENGPSIPALQSTTHSGTQGANAASPRSPSVANTQKR